MNGGCRPYLGFLLDSHRYALGLANVETVVRAVAITPLPKAPAIVLGLINARGRIVPVVSLRTRFRLPDREISLSDQIILARTARRGVALLVDSVCGLVEGRETEIVQAGMVVPGMQYVDGVIKQADGMALIHDLDTFLSLEEEEALESALREVDSGTSAGLTLPDEER
jgi:purine-binding chemotaxis protein CheW